MKILKVLYEELRPEEFVARLNDCPVAYLPLGTLEWHGLHLPLGADGIQSKGFFIKLAERLGGIVLPMLFLGPETNVNIDGFEFVGMDHYSFEDGHPQQLEGTAYYAESQLFTNMLDAIMNNLSRAGFKVVVAHGHGPSNQAIEDNKERFESKYGIKVFNLWQIGGRGNKGIQTDHAAFNETSLVMALRPDLADLDRLSKDEDLIGVWGLDPRGRASEKQGKKIIADQLDIVASRLVDELKHISKPTRRVGYSNMAKLYNETWT